MRHDREWIAALGRECWEWREAGLVNRQPLPCALIGPVLEEVRAAGHFSATDEIDIDRLRERRLQLTGA